MARLYNPEIMGAPAGPYTHGAEVQAGERMIFFSGQVGADFDGNVPDDIEGQMRNAYANIEAILTEAGMVMTDLVKMTTYLVRSEDLASFRDIRNDIMGDFKPAHTLLVISSLARPEFLVEIEGFASKA
ncbi:MAG: RidA family protein [Rhodospirillaceae bacterium]|jgi:enamine deaminase RidA (YjgF/YER057c/UK114 family)|nr:RidA family protein [Rhodospirillaceae bacterium]MBT4589209.1 RidA family protein [Rhodospirillaceae bacterium]MBT7265397.1 RidA family protein [Rhodospirillaceae bacterium]